MDPKTLSAELRLGSGPFLKRRRGVVALSLISVGAMSVITLYQMGLISHLPEPPLPRMKADEVDASEEAYELLIMPDAALGLGSYAATLGLAAMGGQDRAIRRPWIPIALAAKVFADAAQAARLTGQQWTRHQGFCFWCLISAIATFATVPLVIAKAQLALRQFLRQPSS